MIKAYCSDLAWQVVADCIQVFGGYGFIEDYGVAQCARDVKIYSLYEGTNYIQSIDLVNRKFRLKQGQAFANWLMGIKGTIEGCSKVSGLEKEIALLKDACQVVQNIRQWYEAQETGHRSLQPLYSTRTLHCCSMLVCGELLLEQAVIAKQQIEQLGDNHHNYVFYQGKVETARYYIRNIIPYILCLYNIIIAADTSPLDIPEESF